MNFLEWLAMRYISGLLMILFSGAFFSGAAALDNLTVGKSGGVSSDTVILDGKSGNVAVGKLASMGTGGDFTAVTVDVTPTTNPQANTLTNYGEILGLVNVVGGEVVITNYGILGLTEQDYAISTLGSGSTSGGTSKIFTEIPASAANKITLTNFGTINSSIAAADELLLYNYGAINASEVTGDAIQFESGMAVIDNYGLIAVNATGTGSGTDSGTYSALFIGASGTGSVATPATVYLYNRDGAQISGNISNGGTLIIGDFAGKMQGDIVNTGEMQLGTNRVAFVGDYYTHSGGTSAGASGTTAGNSSIYLTLDQHGNHGQLQAQYTLDAVTGEFIGGNVDLSTTDIYLTTHGGMAGETYYLIVGENGLTITGSGGTGSSGGTSTPSSGGTLVIDNRSLTLTYNEILAPANKSENIAAGTPQRGFLGVQAQAVSNAFAHYTYRRDRQLGQQLDILCDRVNPPPAMAEIMRKLNAIDNQLALANAVESLNNRQIDNAQTQLALQAIGEHHNAVKRLLRDFGANKLANFSGGFAGTDAYQAQGVETGGATGAGEKFYRGNVLARFYGGFGEQRGSSETAGYTWGNYGALVGIDYAFARELRLGVLGNFSYNQADLNAGLGNSTDLMTRVGGYVSLNWDGIYFDMVPTFGGHQINNNRHVNVNGWQTIARSDRSTWDISALFNVGMTMNLPGRIYVTPEFSLSPTIMRSPDYHEYGAADSSVHLTTAARTTWSLLQVLQVKFGAVIDLGFGTQLQPEFLLGWEHEYNDTAGTTTNAFAAAPMYQWDNTLSAISRDRLLFGLGLNALIMNELTIFGRWEQRLWSEGFSAAFTLGLAYNF